MKRGANVIAIDPGIQGAFCLITPTGVTFRKMPIQVSGKNRDVDFSAVLEILAEFDQKVETHLFLERAKPIAMGSAHAFNYGRGFAALEIAIRISEIPVTYVEPHVWMKEIFEGLSPDLKPKSKAQIAVRRLCPAYLSAVEKNRNGKLHEGMVDALLIGEYGRRRFRG